MRFSLSHVRRSYLCFCSGAEPQALAFGQHGWMPAVSMPITSADRVDQSVQQQLQGTSLFVQWLSASNPCTWLETCLLLLLLLSGRPWVVNILLFIMFHVYLKCIYIRLCHTHAGCVQDQSQKPQPVNSVVGCLLSALPATSVAQHEQACAPFPGMVEHVLSSSASGQAKYGATLCRMCGSTS